DDLHHRRPLRPQSGGDPGRRVRARKHRAGAHQRRVGHPRPTGASERRRRAALRLLPGVTRLVTEGDVDAARLARILEPRHDVVLEQPDVDGRFVGVGGPFHEYCRTGEGGGLHVRQTVEYRMAFPYFAWLSSLPMRARLGRLDPPSAGRNAWWLPPDRINERSASILATLSLLSVIIGYLGSLLTQTITYAAEEFGVSKGAQ